MNARAVWAPPRPRLFFMHLPKTAGMALRLFLGNQYPLERIMREIRRRTRVVGAFPDGQSCLNL